MTLARRGTVTNVAVRERSPPIVAGIAAGLVLATLGIGTFAVIDNLGGHHNATLTGTAPGVALQLALSGAILASLGAITDREIRATRAHWRRVTGRG